MNRRPALAPPHHLTFRSFLARIPRLNGILSLVAAYYFRQSGLLAAVGVRFWADIVWHVLFGVP